MVVEYEARVEMSCGKDARICEHVAQHTTWVSDFRFRTRGLLSCLISLRFSGLVTDTLYSGIVLCEGTCDDLGRKWQIRRRAGGAECLANLFYIGPIDVWFRSK
jgi:hypothetical protein